MRDSIASPPELENPWLHRYCIVVAVFALLVLVVGAIVTSLERPISPTPGAQIPPAAVVFESWHRLGALFLLVLVASLAKAGKHEEIRQFRWIALSVFVIEAALGTQTVLRFLTPLTDILHALIGQICFAITVALAVVTSKSWKWGPVLVQDSWRPSLRSLAFGLPYIVLLQIALGAAYRYRALGVIWHILNAGIVLLFILIVAVFLVRQFPNHPTLRPAAVALAVITSIQVFLGFTTFLMLILFPETSLAVVVTSVLHVTNGSLTLGASVALATQIRYNVFERRPVTGH